MKGLVFTEFLDFVEQKFSPELVDKIIEKSGVASGGAYTAVGTYPPEEMLKLLEALSEEVNTPISELLKTYGYHLFSVFSEVYPQFFKEKKSSFEFLSSVEDYIHIEVRKLYPDAELPTFDCDTSVPGKMTMLYTSKRPLADLAEGLIKGCIDYHKENIEVSRKDLPTETGAKTLFTLINRDIIKK